jgi:hypothetical protein
VAEQAYSMTPRLPLFMTPLFTWISVPGVNFSQLEPQKGSFLKTLQKNGAFWRKVFSLEMVTNFKDLQFTFNVLLELVGALQVGG